MSLFNFAPMILTPSTDKEFAVVIESFPNKRPHGVCVCLHHKIHGRLVYHNVTNFRWCDDSTQEPISQRVICNSDIHQTGISWDVKDLVSIFVHQETVRHDNF